MQSKLKTFFADFLIPNSIALLCVILAWLGPDFSDVLVYDSQAIAQGQLWRIFTAHFVHLGWPHLAMNLFGLYLVFGFFGRCVSWPVWLLSLAVSSVLISVLIYVFNPEIQRYVGLSGVLHALFMLGGLADIKVRRWEGIIFTGLISLKVIYEQWLGPLPGSEQTAGGPVLVDAHFYGAVVGALVGSIVLYKMKRRPGKTEHPSH